MNNIIKNGRLFFISLLLLVVISVTLLTSFAYQTLNVSLKEGTDELKIKSGVLDVNFNATRRIDINNVSLVNNYYLANYIEFDIDNTKSTESVLYKVKLVDLDYSSSLKTKDFKYVLERKDLDGTYSIISEGDFSNLNGKVFELGTSLDNYIYINTDTIDYLRLYLYLESTNEDQNYLENSYFKGLIEIESIFAKDSVSRFVTKFNIYGNSTKENNITTFLGKLVTDEEENLNKYKISINDQSFYLNEPLRCISGLCDYIDLVNNRVVRQVGVLKLDGSESWKKVDDNIHDSYYLDDVKFNNNLIESDLLKNILIDNVGRLVVVYSDANKSDINSFIDYLNSNDISIYYALDKTQIEYIKRVDVINYVDKDIVATDGVLNSSKIEIIYNR